MYYSRRKITFEKSTAQRLWLCQTVGGGIASRVAPCHSLWFQGSVWLAMRVPRPKWVHSHVSRACYMLDICTYSIKAGRPGLLLDEFGWQNRKRRQICKGMHFFHKLQAGGGSQVFSGNQWWVVEGKHNTPSGPNQLCLGLAYMERAV